MAWEPIDAGVGAATKTMRAGDAFQRTPARSCGASRFPLSQPVHWILPSTVATPSGPALP